MVRLPLIVLISATLTMGLPVGASADWAYTRWGMTPEQVAAASDNKVKVLAATDQTRDPGDDWVMADQGTWSDGTVNGDVGFMFDAKTNRLKCVVYNTTGHNVAPLKAAFLQRYGKPASTSTYGPTVTLTWKPADKIELVVSDQGPAAVVTQCSPTETP
jgi:hypothetical protein